jgi:hypothetical protein
MITNILTRIFSGESSPASENTPTNQTSESATQSFGISRARDSFESTASKESVPFELGLLPHTQDSDATKTQEANLQEKQKLREEQKKFEEMTKETNDKDFFGTVGSLFGDDKGQIDYQDETALNTYNEAEKSSQRISETVDDTSDEVKKHFG